MWVCCGPHRAPPAPSGVAGSAWLAGNACRECLRGTLTGNVRCGMPPEPVSVVSDDLSSRPAHAPRCHSAGRSPFPRKRSAMWGFVCGPHRAPPDSRVRFESLQRLGSLTPPGPAEGGPERFAVGGLFAEASSRLRFHHRKWIGGGTRCCSGLRPRTTRPVRCVSMRSGRRRSDFMARSFMDDQRFDGGLRRPSRQPRRLDRARWSRKRSAEPDLPARRPGRSPCGSRPPDPRSSSASLS